MKRFAYLAVTAILAAAAAWVYLRRDELRLQWECYEVTSAASYEAFQARMDQFQSSLGDYQRARALMTRWHTGNEPFDEFLSRYLFDPQCNEIVREAFSRELSWREDLLAAWAEDWREQKPDVEEQIASIRRYLETLRETQPPRTITWRDVLDLQAVLEIDGHGKLAHRLTPDNWRGRFARWQAGS